MKQDILQNLIKFILKYIWIFCILLIATEGASVAYTSSILMQQSSLGIMQSISSNISGRVDGVLRLLTGLSTDKHFADTSKPLFDRVIHAKPYQESYNLFMIALTDKDISVVTTEEATAPTKPTSLAYRDYMLRLYATGKYQITDPLLSGDNAATMNYTIAVPIVKDGQVEGSVLGSIRFDDIAGLLNQQSQINIRDFYLLSSDNTIMASTDYTLFGASFLELAARDNFLFKATSAVDSDMKAGKSGDFWSWDSDGLNFVTYQRVAPTHWTILYRVQFASVFVTLLPSLLAKVCFFIFICTSLSMIGRHHLSRQLAQANQLLNQMTLIQKEFFQTENSDYDNLLELTQQGLTDQLTGLATRAVLLQKMPHLTAEADASGAVLFIDLDDLKSINDHFRHEGGDCALVHFAQVLKEYELNYGGFAARYGGDEFIFILPGMGKREASVIAQNLCTALRATITIKEHSFHIHGSIGIAFYPEHGSNPEKLICEADLALYSAKQEGKNKCVYYSSDKVIPKSR